MYVSMLRWKENDLIDFYQKIRNKNKRIKQDSINTQDGGLKTQSFPVLTKTTLKNLLERLYRLDQI